MIVWACHILSIIIILCAVHDVSIMSPVCLQDHKPNREDELQRIEALGGTVDLHGVWRVICPEQVVFGGAEARRTQI